MFSYPLLIPPAANTGRPSDFGPTRDSVDDADGPRSVLKNRSRSKGSALGDRGSSETEDSSPFLVLAVVIHFVFHRRPFSASHTMDFFGRRPVALKSPRRMPESSGGGPLVRGRTLAGVSHHDPPRKHLLPAPNESYRRFRE